MLGVMATRDAQKLADAQGFDLVEISPNADPPVCKIMDFGKFRYEESIKRKQARKSQIRQQIKEVKFHASVDEHDLQTKMRHIREFLAEGDKVKITLQYRGRENAHKELGMEVVTRVIKDLEVVAIVEQQPRLLGRLLGCLLAPRPAKPGTTKSSQPAHSAAPRPVAPAAPAAPAAAVAPVAPAAPIPAVSAPAPAPVAAPQPPPAAAAPAVAP
ncbi:MAG: translation initiation factor IF-3 [bacterium]